MNTEQKDTNRRIVQQWKATAPELERMRREELRSYVYDARVVDAPSGRDSVQRGRLTSRIRATITADDSVSTLKPILTRPS